MTPKICYLNNIQALLVSPKNSSYALLYGNLSYAIKLLGNAKNQHEHCTLFAIYCAGSITSVIWDNNFVLKELDFPVIHINNNYTKNVGNI